MKSDDRRPLSREPAQGEGVTRLRNRRGGNDQALTSKSGHARDAPQSDASADAKRERCCYSPQAFRKSARAFEEPFIGRVSSVLPLSVVKRISLPPANCSSTRSLTMNCPTKAFSGA